MEKEGFKRRKCPPLLGKAAGANGHIRKFDAGLVIAGHSELYRDSHSRTVLKVMQPPPKGDIEAKFYNEITTSPLPELKTLRSLCPRFYGVVEDGDQKFLRLEDLTRPFHNPCIIDIKMGRVTWDPDATEAKRAREESKYPPLKKTGFQLLGCRVGNISYRDVLGVKANTDSIEISGDGSDQNHIKLDKKWGRGLQYEELTSGLATFMSGAGNSERQNSVRLSILAKLYDIKEWFLTQNSYRFFASSILVLYEGYSKHDLNSQGSSDSEDDRSCHVNPRVDVRMIDFAHVYPSQVDKLDENYIFGLDNLIKSFEFAIPPS